MSDSPRKNAGHELAQFAVDLKFYQLPEDLVTYIKTLILKGVANIVAGAMMSSSRRMAALVKNRNLPGEVGVLTFGYRTSLWEGVLLNAYFAHAAELEDDAFFNFDGKPCGASWAITVIPLLLTLAQKERLSGKQLIEAVVAGLEVHRRTTLTTTMQNGTMLGPGSVGPAAGAAKALGLNAEQAANAMGLAMSGNDVVLVHYGFDGHFMDSAMSALDAIIAVEAAKEGLTGNPDIESFTKLKFGEDNFYSSDEILRDLGSRWLSHEFWFKKYPCSFGAHGQIDTVLELIRQHNIAYNDIEAIEILPNPVLDRQNPKTWEAAQVSIQWLLGCAALDGDVNQDSFTEEALNSPRYEEACNKVKFSDTKREGLETAGIYGKAEPITIRLKNGTKHSGERQTPIGSVQSPLTTQQAIDLARKFLPGVFTRQQIDTIADAFMNLEKLNDIGEVMDLLTFKGERF